ncbi:sensor histidine kinase [Plantactinospora siamensis]|uniref:Oxygen sensor histidine kinase NreB n=1 Tax=Plantactinospora siamensis TaxID=555372 RepID=A0ABV6P0M3_9ACTN
MHRIGAVGRGRIADLAVVLGVLAVAEFAITTGREAGASPRNWFAYALGVAMAAPLLARRRHPLAALYLVGAALLVFYAVGYPGFPPALVLAAPLYAATLLGHVWPAMPVPAFFLAAGADVSVRHGLPALDTASVFLPQVAVVVVAMLLGALVRSRRAYAAEVRQRLAAVERDRESDAARRVTEERLRIAREVHDTVGHAIATITVQSAAALRLVDRDAERVREALTAIRSTGKAALTELRGTLEALHDGAAEPVGSRDAGLHRLPDLLTAVGAAGLRVEAPDRLDEGTVLPRQVDHAAYRVLQESLTNVLRHAGPAARAEVRLRATPGSLTIEVTDDGVGAAAEPAGPGGGRGLAGMRHRVEAVGGSLHAGPNPAGGFTVRAELPREES